MTSAPAMGSKHSSSMVFQLQPGYHPLPTVILAWQPELLYTICSVGLLPPLAPRLTLHTHVTSGCLTIFPPVLWRLLVTCPVLQCDFHQLDSKLHRLWIAEAWLNQWYYLLSSGQATPSLQQSKCLPSVSFLECSSLALACHIEFPYSL